MGGRGRSGLLSRTFAEGAWRVAKGESKGRRSGQETGRELQGPRSLGAVRGAAYRLPAPVADSYAFKDGAVFLCGEGAHGSTHRSSAPRTGIGVRGCCPSLGEDWHRQGRGVWGRGGGPHSSLALAISDPPKVCSSWVSAETLVTRLLAAISLPNPFRWAICSER